MKYSLTRFTWYPLLFSVYPAIAMLSANIDQIEVSTAMRTVLVSLAGGTLVLLISQGLLKDWPRAALLTLWFCILFFTYGHVYNILEQHPARTSLGHHTILFPTWFVLGVLGMYLLGKKIRSPAAVTPGLNLLVLFLLLLPIAHIIRFNIHISKILNEARRSPARIDGYHLPETGQPPDIYYIILDAYSRDDELLQYYQYDNSTFINDLEALGFYVARCSQSNYAQTELSVSSSLNFNYLDALGDDFIAGKNDRSALWPLIKHSAIRHILESLGYAVVNFKNNYSWLAWEDADYFYTSPGDNELDAILNQGSMNSFEIMFFRSTAGIAVLDMAEKLKLTQKILLDTKSPARTNYKRVLYTLEKLKYDNVPAMSGPKFIYAHIISPHPPFVFLPNGDFKFQSEKDIQGYSNQVAFINQRIEEIVKGIIEHAAVPPVIIIQGDHGIYGYNTQRRMRIFNAYYLPGDGKNLLYPGISPVNTFRVVLNRYLGGSLDLLPDQSYYSSYKKPYDYQEIIDHRPGCGGE